MKNNTKADFSAAFSGLRRRFEQSLPERAELMLKFASEPGAEQFKALLAEAHKLAGACGTFGHHELGLAARHIEQLVKDISFKPVDDQLQALPLLQKAVIDFRAAILEALKSDRVIQQQLTEEKTAARTIWLLLPEGTLQQELRIQLTAFGHEVLCLNSYDECFEKLQKQAPTVLFAAVHFADGSELFNQKSLLKQLSKQQVRLVVYSELDKFSLRIKAAQQRADAFFISPLDVPNIITTVTELIEQDSRLAGRVAIVEDDHLLAEHYELVLNAAGIETLVVNSVPNIISELLKFQPDLLLMDLYMPEYSGPEIAGLLRQYRNLNVYLSFFYRQS